MTNVNRQFQLSSNATELYQRYSGRMLDVWNRALIKAAGLLPGEKVLDVACGTGAATRLAVNVVGSSGKVVGLDLNAGMLTKAREFSLSESGVPIEWREGDAATLPFDDSTFDLILCCQGLQYFPDRNAALREMRRVLVAGGRLVLCVWGLMQDNPFKFAVNDYLKSRKAEKPLGSCALRWIFAGQR